MPQVGEVIRRTAQSRTTYLGKTPDGRNRYAYYGSIGAIHYKDAQGNWQDIDASYEEADTEGFSLKFTKLPYLIRVAEDSKRRIYPDRNDLSYWIEFQKPFANMGKPTRKDGWFYWDFTNANLGVKVCRESVKFGFRLKNSNAPTSITIPFSVQGITRKGNELLHNGQVIGYLRKPIATDALGVERDCQISWASGSVTISLDTTGLAFPIEIDPTFSVGASSDDCRVFFSGITWAISLTAPTQYAGYSSGTYFKIGGGMRFLDLGIAKPSTIDVAYLTFICASASSGTVVNTRITGDKEVAPATWSTLADYQARRGTVVGGANNNYITTAQVDWDSIPAWTLGTSYNSPSIVSILQELVDAWTLDDVALWWDDHDDRSTHATNCYRAIATWDNTIYDPPALYVEWTVAAVGRSYGYIIG